MNLNSLSQTPPLLNQERGKGGELLLVIVFLLALVFRLWLVDKAWHVDILSNAGWGEWIFNHGTKGFYSNSIWTYSWPTQPPLTNLVYAWDKRLHVEILGRMAWVELQLKKILPGEKVPVLSNFVWWFGYGKINTEIPYQIGYLATIKLIPILADMGIAIVLFFICGRRLLWPAIFLISPFSWYLSAMWGQYDGVGFLLALIVCLSIFSNLSILGPALITLAILIKPTSLILLPFFGYLYIRKASLPTIIKLLNCFIVPLLIFWATTAPFTNKNPFEFGFYDLKRIVFEKSEPRVSVNAFNFWRIFIGNQAKRDNLQAVSFLIFGALNIWGIYQFEKNKNSKEAMWTGLFIISAGSFLFMTGMLDRYLYAGMVFGLIYVSTRRKLYEWWAVWSIIFWVNLYYHWWIPESFSFLKQLLLWNKDILTRLLSLVNIVIFIVLTRWRLGSFRKLLSPPVLGRKNKA